MNRTFRHILGMKVDSGTYESSTARIRDWASNGEARYVCVANVHMTMETVDSDAFKQVVNSADLVTSDGMPLVWMLKMLGLPASERVYGPELVLRVCEMAEREGLSIGLYGGTESSLASFTSFLATRYPRLSVAYSWAPPFRPLTDEEDARVIREVRESGARILFVGIGCPKQERWMHAHRDSIQAVQLGVGAAFDFHSGAIRQAPAWMGKSGLEWLFRLTMEPKRLWKRYVVHNPRFILGALLQVLKTKLGPSAALLILPLLLALAPLHRPAGQAYWVSQAHPSASDSNPGTRDLPFLTIGNALSQDLLQPGDTLFIESGVYREELRPKSGGLGPQSRIVIMAPPGQQVTVSGADVYGLPDRYNDSLWVIPNYYPLGFYGDGTTYERELVVANGRTLNPVFSRGDLREGTFFVERSSDTNASIFLNSATAGPPVVELAKRGSLFKPGNRWTGCDDPTAPGWFYIHNLTFVHAANQAQSGAVCMGSEGSVLDSVRVEWTNGVGIEVIGRNHEIHDSRANHNGQAGINGTCANCLLMSSETSYNNRVGHDPFWEAGGGKWIASQRVRFIYHTAVGNDGPGLWFDGDNYDMNVSYAHFDSNLVAGVFVELRSEAVHLNRINVQHTRRKDWSGAGILIQAAGGVTVESSHISDNDGAGIWVRADDRYEGGFNRFLDNSIEGNGANPGQDKADVQIEAASPTDLCSNQISMGQNQPEKTSFLFEISKPYDLIVGDDIQQYKCLVRYN